MATDTNVSNTYDIGGLKFWALGDRILIEEDEFKTGYECEGCNGAGRVACGDCSGSGASARVKSARCATCAGEGATMCPACSGKGGLLVAPDIAQRRPTTGTIVSVGPECKTLQRGDNVLYSNFAGYSIDLQRAGRKVVLRILHETEILCAMDGHLDLRSLKGQTEVTFGGN